MYFSPFVFNLCFFLFFVFKRRDSGISTGQYSYTTAGLYSNIKTGLRIRTVNNSQNTHMYILFRLLYVYFNHLGSLFNYYGCTLFTWPKTKGVNDLQICALSLWVKCHFHTLYAVYIVVLTKTLNCIELNVHLFSNVAHFFPIASKTSSWLCKLNCLFWKTTSLVALALPRLKAHYQYS